ncbi:conserved hypothetical protein [Aster yellows witches'-broom phytoplasma AYWB]|uniref:Uncharacterized protein n=2 Tax=16SrI (Aster yellows group) TaxID=3042590 RepID=Q2NJI0_AYWBP|nr:conserved hypothetical protein [Aster yellows witches'-broom phytoplasma AYWB]
MKKTEILHKQNCITAAIKKYNKRKNNHQVSTNHDNQTSSSRQNINSIIEVKK